MLTELIVPYTVVIIHPLSKKNAFRIKGTIFHEDYRPEGGDTFTFDACTSVEVWMLNEWRPLGKSPVTVRAAEQVYEFFTRHHTAAEIVEKLKVGGEEIIIEGA